MKRAALILAAAALLAPAEAAAQSVAGAIASGQVGERFDGYMGFAATPSPELRREVQNINIQRRNLYTEMAVRRSVTPDLVGRATACQLFTQLAPAEPYLLSDGRWRRHAPGEAPPVPEQCR